MGAMVVSVVLKEVWTMAPMTAPVVVVLKTVDSGGGSGKGNVDDSASGRGGDSGCDDDESETVKETTYKIKHK